MCLVIGMKFLYYMLLFEYINFEAILLDFNVRLFIELILIYQKYLDRNLIILK